MNLDRSLDEILESKRSNRTRRGNRASNSAPSAGVRKRPTRSSQRNTTSSAAATAGPAASTAAAPSGKAQQNDTKILVSLLPHDVSEAQIKDYFAKTIGAIKKCQLIYGPSGVSRGMATLEFAKAGDANLAYQKYNGIVVDKRPIKVEIVVDPTRAPFASRIQAPKPVQAPAATTNKPKSAAADRSGRKAGRGRNTRRGSGPGGARRSKKTTDELDADMADYFKGNDNGDTDTNANTAPTAA